MMQARQLAEFVPHDCLRTTATHRCGYAAPSNSLDLAIVRPREDGTRLGTHEADHGFCVSFLSNVAAEQLAELVPIPRE
ncbi:hypothetical protein GGF32_000825 [Allomyces javanicus]|nr:hypothetical protein GGF32_000825 [Allomyces javanicus]